MLNLFNLSREHLNYLRGFAGALPRHQRQELESRITNLSLLVDQMEAQHEEGLELPVMAVPLKD